MNSEIQKIIGGAAPLLGSALLGPIGGLLASAIASSFGVTAGDDGALLGALQTDPNAALKLKQIENQHSEILRGYDVQDRSSARDREAAMAKAGMRDWVPPLLALSFALIYVIIQVYVVIHPGTEDDMISARLQDIMVMIISYYFGSSNKSDGGKGGS